MAASRAAPVPVASRRENLRLFLIAASVTAILVLPIGVAVGMSWIELPFTPSTPARAAAPDWLPLSQVRATTLDGNFVKVRVAVDVHSPSARGTLQRNAQQVGLLLETTVASRTREEIRTADGLQDLSEDMRDRLNDYLESEGDRVVRSVAIQDLIVNPR